METIAVSIEILKQTVEQIVRRADDSLYSAKDDELRVLKGLFQGQSDILKLIDSTVKSTEKLLEVERELAYNLKKQIDEQRCVEQEAQIKALFAEKTEEQLTEWLREHITSKFDAEPTTVIAHGGWGPRPLVNTVVTKFIYEGDESTCERRKAIVDDIVDTLLYGSL